jgi:LacI family transcriptional regulator
VEVNKADQEKRPVAYRRKSRKRILISSFWQEEEAMRAILAAASDLNWEITDENFLHPQAPKAFKADGIICCQWTVPDIMKPLIQARIPVVHTWAVRSTIPPDERPVVASDTRLVGAMAATHFLERGFKQVCYLSVNEYYDESDPLISSLKAHLEHGGARFLGANRVELDGPGWRSAFDRTLDAWLGSMPRPLGVLTSGDILGGHVVGFCKAFGIAVPEEIAVLGIGNKQRWCDMSPCPLSSIDLNPVARARKVVALLQRMMGGEAAPAEPVLITPARVIPRKSTDIMATTDLTVAKAVTFLWEHLSLPISVNEAAAAAGISRSSLERRFRKAIGRSVNEELLRKRLERCRELLLTTDLPFVDIAPKVGFLSKTYLHRIFREHYHCTPKDMRRCNQSV